MSIKVSVSYKDRSYPDPSALQHINDLLVADSYLASANAGRDMLSCRETVVNRLNVAFQIVTDWGDANLVTFNTIKTQACLFSTKRSRIHLAPTFRGVSGRQSTDCSKKKLGILSKVRRYLLMTTK